MDYADGGDSESELLGAIQESQRTLEDPTSETDEPADLPLSYERGMQQANSRRLGYRCSYYYQLACLLIICGNDYD